VGPNLAFGPVLRERGEMTLELDDPSLCQTWTATTTRRARLSVSEWRVDVLEAGSREAMRVEHGRVYGRRAADLIGGGRRKPGSRSRAMVGQRLAARVSFASRWRPGAFMLRIHIPLEDSAGSCQRAAFEQADLPAVDCCSEDSKRFPLEARRVHGRVAENIGIGRCRHRRLEDDLTAT